MKKLLIIALLIVGVFAQEEMGELEKQLLYKQNDRSPLLAYLYALTPTMGHIYVGKWNKRLLTSSLPLSLSFLGLSEYSNNEAKKTKLHTNPVDWEKYRTWGKRGDTFRDIGYATIAVWYALQIQDAIYLAYQHNADLYEEIYGKEYIKPPKKSIIQKCIDKKEAKKSNSLH